MKEITMHIICEPWKTCASYLPNSVDTLADPSYPTMQGNGTGTQKCSHLSEGVQLRDK